MTTRQDVVNTARGLLGVRWRHQGRNESGLDCLGLIVTVAHRLGLSDADANDYGRIPDGRRLREALTRHMDITAEYEPGDVLLFRFERFPMHVGIVTDAGMIHAYANMRKVIEHRLDEVWRSRIVAAFRFRGVAE